jgi:hypothetical protein
VLCTSLGKCAKMLGQNHFIEPNQHVLTFLHPILICRIAHTEHTGGVALSFNVNIIDNL